jgi:hypothetical protein
MIAVADHFEPSILPQTPWKYADMDEQDRRLERWCLEYPKVFGGLRDSDGRPFPHTYFYPAEQYQKNLLERLAQHCKDGWGEVEIHLHHGVTAPDTSRNTRQILLRFVDELVGHGCLSRWNGEGQPRYAFVHGNWALANSAGGNGCGVDDEMQILSDTGCYADMTLPSAPHRAQIAKINSLYECALSLDQKAPHREGRDLRYQIPPKVFPLIVQGPLGLNFARQIKGVPFPYIENGALTTSSPPTMHRFNLWRREMVSVKGMPDWVFIKLHCHGMDPRDESAMLGPLMTGFLQQLLQGAKESGDHLHFVTAREMVNIILAACDGRQGSPSEYRDYRLQLISPRT